MTNPKMASLTFKVGNRTITTRPGVVIECIPVPTVRYTGTACVDCVVTIESNPKDMAEHAALLKVRHPDVSLACRSWEYEEYSSAPCECCGSTLAGSRDTFIALA